MAEQTYSFQGNILIVGASAAGVSAAKEIRRVNREARITIITDEKHFPYYRPLLTKMVTDSTAEKSSTFLLMKEEWYHENDITLITGERVAAVIPSETRVRTESGQKSSYDRLILAPGSCHSVPIPGALDRENVFAIRTMEDARAVHSHLEGSERIVIIGGGLLGLEMADALLKMKKRIVIAEKADRILPIQLDPEGSRLLESMIRSAGCPLFLGDYAMSLMGYSRVSVVQLKSGRTVPSDLVIFSIGVQANIALAVQSGIAVNRGILVNERMETSIPGVYACGDVAEFHRCFNLWMPAVRQGTVAGANAAGGNEIFSDEDYPASLNVFGTTIFSIGDLGRQENPVNYTELRSLSSDGKIYKKLYFRNDVLSGGILMGDNSKAQALTKAVRTGMAKLDAADLLE
jgi:NAD(P)H-nitrite reductase large subunit